MGGKPLTMVARVTIPDSESAPLYNFSDPLYHHYPEHSKDSAPVYYRDTVIATQLISIA